ncbi:hypothetical protein OG618_00400 [Kitasatospora sp. NBC_01246]|uniref:hypothetical protein n=1 Tax=Kitasatospora sp. NBC_01246 TaxID=2903570 RepID=UPI002E37D6F3|nr:hypothetical protein [Kitasatospora sp. NBC_01246]
MVTPGAAFGVHPAWLAEELDLQAPCERVVRLGLLPLRLHEPLFAQASLDGRL